MHFPFPPSYPLVKSYRPPTAAGTDGFARLISLHLSPFPFYLSLLSVLSSPLCYYLISILLSSPSVAPGFFLMIFFFTTFYLDFSPFSFSFIPTRYRFTPSYSILHIHTLLTPHSPRPISHYPPPPPVFHLPAPDFRLSIAIIVSRSIVYDYTSDSPSTSISLPLRFFHAKYHRSYFAHKLVPLRFNK
ncbi:hypothetical protein BOTBODRAFT_335785 [Botryobasidium botryosum FD-172 SS1]|uniref:Uncharacterized protein n=1 Tax=Botryobasidium botryosum (strain FD-172 SS1) TaxID=930990 RepID=A0A067MRW6_BOTB1|nr:hypothetical protein BOTBODRAFT_335785 [Botryobasidium botryosum FD-172 SS1]